MKLEVSGKTKNATFKRASNFVYKPGACFMGFLSIAVALF